VIAGKQNIKMYKSLPSADLQLVFNQRIFNFFLIAVLFQLNMFLVVGIFGQIDLSRQIVLHLLDDNLFYIFVTI